MSYADLFSTIVGAESATQEALTVAQERLVGKTAEEVAEDIIDRDIAVAEKNTTELVASVEAHSDKLEVLDELVSDLEESLDGMESMIKGEKPFNPELFKVHYNKGTKLGNRLGLNLERQGSESFASKETAEFTAHAGCEAMKDVAAKAMEEAKKILIQIWDFFINGISGFVTMFGSLETKAKSLLDNLSEDKLITGSVKLPDDAVLLYNGKTNDFYRRLVNASKAFSNYIPTKNSYETICNTLAGKIGDGGTVVVNKDSGSVSVEKSGKASEQARPLGLTGVKNMLEDIISGASDVLKGQANTKDLQTQRDKAIANMGSSAKEEKFVEQKKYGRLSAKVILQGMNVMTRILKAQFAVVKANYK